MRNRRFLPGKASIPPSGQKEQQKSASFCGIGPLPFLMKMYPFLMQIEVITFVFDLGQAGCRKHWLEYHD
jgi:hypothetical protein